jgi:tetratricopeptide (TPR) repeat protein
VTGFLRAVALVATTCCVVPGCVLRGPLIEPAAGAIELEDTPFFAQDRYQCGPAALAMVLQAAGIPVTPDELVKQVYVPERRGSLTIEMQAAPRRYGRLAYALAPRLETVLAELDAGRPVLVLHNYGLAMWPRWHYAVVIGYDAAKQRVVLRSGKRARQQLSAANFMRAWDNADRWAIVVLEPGQLPARPDLPAYLEAATAFERVAAPAATGRVFDAAIGHWPQEPVAWVGRGTAHYRSGNLQQAAADYARAVDLDPSLAGARNNLAMVLLELGCSAAARAQLDRIDQGTLQGALREAVADTARQVQARTPGPDAGTCVFP